MSWKSWELDYQHLHYCKSEINLMTFTPGLPRWAKSHLVLYFKLLKSSTYFLCLSYGKPAERLPVLKGSWPSRLWIEIWPKKNVYFCPRTQSSWIISERSCAKLDLSPSQENPAEDSRKSLFKVERVLSIYVPLLKNLCPWLHFWPVQLFYNPPKEHIDF